MMPKVFTKYNADLETEFITIGHGQTEIVVYSSSCEHYFSIYSGWLKCFCFVLVASSMNNIFV